MSVNRYQCTDEIRGIGLAARLVHDMPEGLMDDCIFEMIEKEGVFQLQMNIGKALGDIWTVDLEQETIGDISLTAMECRRIKTVIVQMLYL